MTAHPRLLVVMRHGKAETSGASDHERELTDRGRDDAAAAGRWLARQGVVPDHAVVSSATRTRSTWDEVSRACGATAAASVEDALYAAGPEVALDVLRGSPTGARCVIFVGHNPTAAYLAHLLDDGDADTTAFDEMSRGYPTSALTVLEVPGSWADLTAASARITAFHVGRAT